MRCALIVFLLVLKYFCASAIEHDSLCKKEELDCHEPSHIVFRLPERDDARAAAVAKQHDMRVVGQPFLDSHYFLQHLDHMNGTKSRRHKRETVERLRNSAHVEWVEEQRPKRRVKRDFIIPDENATDSGYRQERSTPRFLWKDPLFRDQWYLNEGAAGNYDMNVREAWLLDYTGWGVVVSILDDGIQRDHPDLRDNYDPLASTDVNDHDDDPTPQNNGDNNPRPLKSGSLLVSKLLVDGCMSYRTSKLQPVLYLEHVQVIATARFGRRGDLRLILVSPSGTSSELLPPRREDDTIGGFDKWPFMTVQMWGEDPRGEWMLIVETVSQSSNFVGTFHNWELLLYGTATAAQRSAQRSDHYLRAILGSPQRAPRP